MNQAETRRNAPDTDDKAATFKLITTVDELFNRLETPHGPQASFPSHSSLGETLLNAGLLSAEQLAEAQIEQRANPDTPLAEIIEQMDMLDSDRIQFTLATRLDVPIVDLNSFELDPAAAVLIPVYLAQRFVSVPFMFHSQRLVIAVADPVNDEALDVFKFITNRRIEVVVASKALILEQIKQFYPSEMDTGVDYFGQAEKEANQDIEQDEAQKEAERLAAEKPVVRLVDGILRDAVNRQASDIHIRPLEDRVSLLYRIDGILVDIRSFGLPLLPAVVSRIKVVSNMNIAERRLPQDGQTRFVNNEHVVDLRISTIPTIAGESVVIRLLDSSLGLKDIAAIGFLPTDQKRLSTQIHRSAGLILVTGPTGSGKSTTLYAALQDLKQLNRSILSVEDPVEYKISGIEQIQVNPATGFSFATAVKHILRHDPDSIMIGEIRDQETAKIALESALTGHLVLSSLHTTNAAGAVARLIDMGIEPFLLSASLRLVIAQRLVRKLCENCREHDDIDPTVRKKLGIKEGVQLFRSHGCTACNGTGYRGRIAAYEMLQINDDLRHLIERGAHNHELNKAAIESGMVSINRSALQLVATGVTSVEEFFRVMLD